MVLVGLDHRPETLAVLERAGVPWEITWSLDESGRHHCIGFSHRSASIRVTQHLLDLGHREIAVIAGDTKRNDRARERLAGVKDALAARGVKLPAKRVVEVEFSVANGRAGLAKLLERAPGFTAVIGGNDPLAIGALFECRDRGIDVPGQMSIAGFDDIELAGELSPGLTTIRVPSAEIGREAGRRLLARLAGKGVPRVKEMPAPLIVRGTTGAPPRRP
jgi:LacI family transcriptional regulator